ncbi:MAG TPA: cobalamin-dependent protein [Prolixibacteraceae bacterium]|nr:cobalamin-dependent protein [Prolixibacteraceae bacterium]
MKLFTDIQNDRNIFLEALLEGNRKKGSTVARAYSGSTERVKILYDQVIRPSLYRVGELWEYNRISVAAEHLATALSESIMNELYEGIISDERSNKKVLLGCVENELHQVGIKMVADVFEMNGWDTFFLGAGVPAHELIEFAQTLKPDRIALSLTVYSHLPALEKMIGEIEAAFPKTGILIGGQAFRHGAGQIPQKFPKFVLLRDLSETEEYIKNMHEYEPGRTNQRS